jgi:hypothetical protein
MKELKPGTEENLSGEHPERIRGWFESLAVASRPLQRHLAETNFETASSIVASIVNPALTQSAA